LNLFRLDAEKVERNYGSKIQRSSKLSKRLSVDKVNLQGSVVEVPSREDIPTIAEEQLVIEFYSRV
jgi:small subunit ribosomal protein S4